MRRSDDDPDQTRVLLGPDPSRRRLSPREREVALLMADGLKDELIARRLGISAATVGNYVMRIRRRLKLDSREELAAWVRARIDPDDPSGRLRRQHALDAEAPGSS